MYKFSSIRPTAVTGYYYVKNNFSIFARKAFFLTSKYNFLAITEPNLKKIAEDCGWLNHPPNKLGWNIISKNKNTPLRTD